jgi:methyl-accepting chemotaxis protein
MLPDGPFLAAASPILTSANTGPARGTLVMGRYLNDQWIARLAEQIKARVRVFPLGKPDLSTRLKDVADSLRRTGQYQIVPENEQVIRGYALIRYIFGDPSLLLEVEASRDMHHQGLLILRYNFISLVAIGLTFGLAMHILVEKRILSRITGLGGQIAAVRADPDASRDIRVQGGDEIAALARAIREMLREIESAQKRLAESEKRSNWPPGGHTPAYGTMITPRKPCTTIPA